jgi:hypothetical protein
MTQPQHAALGRDRVPGLGDEQPPAEVVDACWSAVAIIDRGWQFKRLEFDDNTATAFVVAQSPTHRVVTVHWDLRGHRLGRQQVPGRRDAMHLLKFANDVASLGIHDAETGEALLDQLCWLVQTLSTRVRPAGSWRCTDTLPTLPADEQPRPAVRAAAWLIARLTCEYNWWVRHLGEDIAAGGFLAEVPGDVLAVFPASMSDDGTAGAALARMMPTLSAVEVNLLRHLDYRTLWAAGHCAGAGQ